MLHVVFMFLLVYFVHDFLLVNLFYILSFHFKADTSTKTTSCWWITLSQDVQAVRFAPFRAAFG